MPVENGDRSTKRGPARCRSGKRRNLARPACGSAPRGGRPVLGAHRVEARPPRQQQFRLDRPADFQAGLQSSVGHQRQRGSSSRSSIRTTIPTSLQILRPIVRHFGFGTAKFTSTTSKANRKTTRRAVRVGASRSISTFRWSRPSARTVRSTSSRRTARPATIMRSRRSAKRSSSARTSSATVGSATATRASIDPSYFDKPGVIYTAGSGDEGYNVIGPPMAPSDASSRSAARCSRKSGSGYQRDGLGRRRLRLRAASAETEMAARSELLESHRRRRFGRRPRASPSTTPTDAGWLVHQSAARASRRR